MCAMFPMDTVIAAKLGLEVVYRSKPLIDQTHNIVPITLMCFSQCASNKRRSDSDSDFDMNSMSRINC